MTKSSFCITSQPRNTAVLDGLVEHGGRPATWHGSISAAIRDEYFLKEAFIFFMRVAIAQTSGLLKETSFRRLWDLFSHHFAIGTVRNFAGTYLSLLICIHSRHWVSASRRRHIVRRSVDHFWIIVEDVAFRYKMYWTNSRE